MTVGDVIDTVVVPSPTVSTKLAKHLRTVMRASLGDASTVIVTPEKLDVTRSFCDGFVAGYLAARVE